MADDASNGTATWKVATMALAMIAAGACAYSYLLYSAFSMELAAARYDFQLAHNEVVNLRAQLSTTEVDSPASGGHVRRPLVISAHGMLQIGAAQGWQFAPGQIVTLDNDKYRPIVRIIS